MKRLFILIAVITVVAFVVAACGGGQPSGQAPAATQPPAQQEKPEKEEGGKMAMAGDPAKGEELYMSTCASCHGPDARGLPNLGKNLRTSEFVKGLSDEELLDFIKKGRPASDPANTTGVDMPPKGGNPALTDEDIMHIIAYIRSIEE